jgi:tripartite-type tricarboxylate transporter receptor subunit TctC
MDRRSVLARGAATLAASVTGPAWAQAPEAAVRDYPSRRIQVILPFPAGGIVDIVTRIVTDKMAETWRQPIIVDPKPGANGNIAWDIVSRAPPDGYTWTFFNPSTIVNPRLQPGLNWSEKDFVPVGAAVWAPSVVIVHPSVPVRSMAELFAYVHAHPHKLNWSHPGIGSSMHLNSALMIHTAKLDMVEVAYKGQPPAIIDILAGRIHVQVASVGLVSEHIKSGAVRPLAIVGKTRSPVLPDVPTLSEAGFPDINVVAWYGYAVPKDTAPGIVEKIVVGFNAALADPKVRASLEGQGLQMVEPMTPAALKALVAADTEKYAALIRDAGLKLDK